METYQTNQPRTPGKSTSEIIAHAFEVYKGVFLYGLLAIIIYTAASFLIQPITGFDSNLISEEIKDADGEWVDFWEIPGFRLYYGVSGIVSLLLAPLFIGVIYIASKYDNQQPLQASDLFIGYRQNFVNILIYSLLASVIMSIALIMCVLPYFLIAPLLFLGYPILLFENASFVDAFKKSFKIAGDHYVVFLFTSILALLVSLAGILLCGIGIFATIPFYLVVMYSAYCAFCGRPHQVNIQR